MEVCVNGWKCYMLSGDDKRVKKKNKLYPRRLMSRGLRSVSTAEPSAVTHVTSHLENAHWASALTLQEAVMTFHSLTPCPTLPPPPPTGAQCQLRGGSFCAGIPVQSARWDGPCDGASATRPHAAVRRQGEHRALYGTLPLNHAHSLCLSDTLLPSSAFIVFRGTNSLPSVCTSWCQVFLAYFLTVESQYCRPQFYLKRGKQDRKWICGCVTGVTLLWVF